MTNYQIITEIFRRESDQFTDDPIDRGGATKYGVTQHAWDSYCKRRGMPTSSVEQLDETAARNFYFDEHIAGPRFDHIKNDLLREFVVDSGVNHGAARATRWLQSLLGAEPDGIIGPDTLALLAQAPPLALFLHLVGIRQRFYAQIVKKDPSQARFIEGWTNRCMEFLDRVAALGQGG